MPLEAILKDGVRGRPDVAALTSLEARRLGVLVWHYHDDVPGPAASVRGAITGLPRQAGEAKPTRFRVDETHGNAFAA